MKVIKERGGDTMRDIGVQRKGRPGERPVEKVT